MGARRRRAAKSGRPLSSGQQRMWFMDQLSTEGTAYSLAGRFRLRGPLDAAALRLAFRELVRRHEILRTTYQLSRGELVQVLRDADSVAFTEVDLSGLTAEELDRTVGTMSVEDSERYFDLATGPLFSIRLARITGSESILFLAMHHIVADGWSFEILFRELSDLYDAFRAGRSSPLPDLPIQYSDFARWQQRWLVGPACEAQLGYWRRKLARFPLEIKLPVENVPATERQDPVGRATLDVSPETVRRLRDIGHDERATIFMVLLCVYGISIARLCGAEDFVIACPVANRPLADAEQLIGFFVNLLPIAVSVDQRGSFRDMLRRMRGGAIEALEYQDVPFERIVAALRPSRKDHHRPLHQVMFDFLNMRSRDLRLSGVTVQELPPYPTAPGADFILFFKQDQDSALTGELWFDLGLYRPETGRRLVGFFTETIHAVAADPDQPIAQMIMNSSGVSHVRHQ